MNIICLNLEDVLAPRIQIAFAETLGIPELHRIMRDKSNYDKLMRYHIDTLKEHGLGLKEIQGTTATIDPMPGIKEFLDEPRSFTQVMILGDTFTQFASPLMRKFSHSAILCNSFEVAESSEVTGFKIRIEHSKLTTVRMLRSIDYETTVSDDSYSDLDVIKVSKAGFLFQTTEEIKKTYPQYPVSKTYAELLATIKAAQWRDEQRTISRKEAVFSCVGNRSVYIFVTAGREKIRMTETIFDRDPREFCLTTKVLSLTKRMADGKTYSAVILDRTAFFPEQGGRKADRDTLDGTKILDVAIRDGTITHLVDTPLSVGSTVTKTVDWVRRFDSMQ